MIPPELRILGMDIDLEFLNALRVTITTEFLGEHGFDLLHNFEHVIKMRTSYFDTVFVSQMKLTTLPLIHCFEGEGCVGRLAPLKVKIL